MSTESKREKTDGKGVVAKAVNIVGPEGEQAVAAPGASLFRGGSQIMVVQRGRNPGRQAFIALMACGVGSRGQ